MKRALILISEYIQPIILLLNRLPSVLFPFAVRVGIYLWLRGQCGSGAASEGT